MLSILPEGNADGRLADWAQNLRDNNLSWMKVAQNGVQAFVGHAMSAKVPFAMETVFSYWEPQPDGAVKSKIDLITDMQAAGYFVLLFFVGLTDENLSILRVQTRVASNGHDVEQERLIKRFPKTQRAINQAMKVADAAILTDNSREPRQAFTVCSVRMKTDVLFDLRQGSKPVADAILRWLNVVSPVQERYPAEEAPKAG